MKKQSLNAHRQNRTISRDSSSPPRGNDANSYGESASDAAASNSRLSDSVLSDVDRRKFQSVLLKWYAKHGRRLPWRVSSDPYRVWLSEIMLQQTTVTAVVPYFQRFLVAFPTVNDLAQAELDQVLRLWEGLGYYSRARNLHRAAKVVCEQYGGRFPADVHQLNSLPGVGRYTAGAIASFAFNQSAPIVEANTERLYARLIGLNDDVKSSNGQKQLWKFAEFIVPLRRAGDANQALMDVGSSICTPQDPNCSVCPLTSFCRAFRDGTQRRIPVRKPRVSITEVSELAVVIQHRGRVLLRRRATNERWAGMWDFARLELSDTERELVTDVAMIVPKHASKSGTAKNRRSRSLFETPHVSLPGELVARVSGQLGMSPARLKAWTEFRYSVTRYRIALTCFLAETDKPKSSVKTMSADSVSWFSFHELADLPLSQTGRKIANWVLSVTNGD